MDASSLLIDTYKRYKTGTKAFVQWLATSARATGTVDDVFPAVPTSGRLKGKARKDNKNQQQTPAKHFQVPLRHFSRLAEAIVAYPTATVPPSMFTILRDVISKRKECATFYRFKHTKATKAEKDQIESHEYCITVFEEVLATLVKKEVKVEFKKVNTTDEPGRLSNLFSALDLHKTVEDEDEDDQIRETRQVSTGEDYVLESTPEEAEFALFCLFKDATEIRFFVRRTWRLYKSGSVSLETAALTMNIAISMIESLDKMLLKSFPKFPEFKDHLSICKFLWGQRWHPDVVKVPGGGPEFYKAYSDGIQELTYPSLICGHTAYLMQQFLLTPVSDGMLPHLRPFKVPLTTEEVTFWETMVQLSVISMTGIDDLPEDMVLKAVCGLVKHQLCPTWAVFALQCVRDTQFELGTSIGDGLKDLKATTDPVLVSLLRYFGIYLPKIGTWHDTYIMDIVEFNNRMVPQLYGDIVADVVECRKLPRRGIVFDHRFLLGHVPMLCGLIAQDNALRTQQWATILAASQEVIKAVAHLYNAAKSIGLLSSDTVWEDLEYILQELGESFIFRGPRPCLNGEFQSSFHLACGYRTSRSKTTCRLSKKEVQEAEALRAQGQGRRLRFLSKYAHICSAVKAGQMKHSDAYSNPAALLQSLLAVDGSPTSNEKDMDPVQMLSKIRETLQRDQRALRFSVMNMWLRCHKLLHSILHLVIRAAPHDYPVSEYGHGLAPMMVVSSLLSERAGSPTLDAPQFAAAIKIMRQVISTEGDVECKAAAARIPDNGDRLNEGEEPSFENPVEDDVSWEDRIKFFNSRDRKVVIIVDRGGKLEQAFAAGYVMVGCKATK